MTAQTIAKKIICVDLDGSLILTDMLYETAIAAFKKNPFIFFKILLVWLTKGKAYCKKILSESVDIDSLHVPINYPVLHWLEEQKKCGHELYLVTAAGEVIAKHIANLLGIFNDVFATVGMRNLNGNAKRDFLDEKFGCRKYVYLGNSACDLTVFSHAIEAIVVNNSATYVEKVKKITTVSQVFKNSKNNVATFLKAMRIHQYAKNSLLFLPIFLGHQITHVSLIFLTILGCICFSLFASSAYVLNDLLDLSADRLHPTKRFRPLANGDLSIQYGMLISIGCLVVGLLLSACMMPIAFTMTLICYYVITLAYSFKLKKLLLIDVFTLAILYTLRIIAGMTILGAYGYSTWLLLFSFFFFMSLAFMKRFSELKQCSDHGNEKLVGRAYNINHVDETKIFGICSGFVSTFILALYVQSQESLRLYDHSDILFLICPLVLYWILRAWLLTVDGKMHDDPIVFSLKDKTTYWIAAIVFMMTMLAIL